MGDLSIIDFYSLPVVLVEVLATTGVKLANATAFCIEHGGKHFLVTNWHNVAGREPFTGELKGPIRPERLRIHYRSYEDENLQGEDLREEELYDDSQPRWLEPKNQVVRRPAEGVNLRVDVALLEIRNPPTQLVSLPWTQNTFFQTADLVNRTCRDRFCRPTWTSILSSRRKDSRRHVGSTRSPPNEWCIILETRRMAGC